MSAMHKILVLISSVILLNSCGGGGGSISVLPTTDAYDESSPINAEMDILWVVDPSRSMRQNVKFVSDNIESFVADFVTKGYKFRMGVISTAAWAKLAYDVPGSGLPSQLDTVLGQFHQGECIGNPSGHPIMHEGSAAPNDVFAFTEIFRKNFDVYGLELNTSGCGLNHLTGYAPVTGNVFASLDFEDRSKIAEYINDERPLQSMESFLTNHGSFVRPNAFLAVIIISDEMDASRSNLAPTSAYNPADPTNYDVSRFVNFLNTIKGGDSTKYAVYSIINEDLAGANNNISKLIAEQTGGLAFDIKATPSEYRDNLNQIKGNIISSSSVYTFQRKPMVSSITVEIIKAVGGQIISVPEASPPGSAGWTFDANYGLYGGLFFNGEDYIPSEGDQVIVRFTPADLAPGAIKNPYINISSNSVLEEQAIGTTVGTVSVFNYNLKPTDEVHYEIDPPSANFSIDALTGVVTTAAVLDAETTVSELVTVKLTITHKDSEGNTTGTTPLDRNITIVTLDIADEIPVANPAVIVSSESDHEGANIVIMGTLSRYVSGMDVSELHTFSADTADLTAVDEELVFTNTATGAFTYTIPKSSLVFDGSGNFTRAIPYTVTGSEHIPDPFAVNSDSETLTITISEANNAPVYSTTICPGGAYEYCDVISGEHVVRPNTEGVTFGEVPLTGADISVSGTASGNKDNLISGNADFRSAPNGQGYHEVTITFPTVSGSQKMYEIGCIQITRDDDSSLGNAIYQILTPGDMKPVTREVFPVGISGNSNIPRPSGLPSGQCTTSSSYFTIYTEGKFIGGGLRILRPSGSRNPQGHDNLRLDRIRVFGIEAKFNEIALDDHFTDIDGDDLTYTITDAFGEGPGPGWASIDPITKTLRLLPSASVNETIGIIAADGTGAGAKEAFASIKVVGSGGSSASNAPPISLLALDDSKRGGLSMRRWGGSGTPLPGSCTLTGGRNNLVQHIEIDNFIEKPFGAATGYYDITTDPIQIPHITGDVYGSEPQDGWCNEPVYVDDKYPVNSVPFCSDTNFDTTGTRGKIIPCVNAARSYGEIYSGYFVPAQTGVYKFRTRVIDNTIMLRIAPTEYYDDTQKLFVANWQDASMEAVLRSLINYPTEDFGSTAARNSEFAGTGSGTSLTNYRAIPYNTELFFNLNGITTDYSPGYIYLKQGNVYAFEMRFGEGGGGVHFDFEYNRKDVGTSTWDGWTPMDASVVVPDRGPNAYTPFEIEVGGGNAVSFDAKTLFYDAEMDVLEYSARLVNLDGTSYGDGTIGQIGLSINLLTGMLTGNLNAYSGDPRIVIKAKERRSGGNETESLPIRFAE